jgi:hypothetical protein
MIQLRYAFIVAAALSAAAVCQETFTVPVPPPPPLPPGGDGMVYVQKGVAINGPDVAFFHAEFGMEGKVVKGAPYSAQAVTEFTQTLADGNRISRTTTSFVARDSEGRTRREQSFGAIGPFAPSAEGPKIISIHDPVAGASYMLDAITKVDNQMHEMHGPPPEHMAKIQFGAGHLVTEGGAPGKEPSVNREALGVQSINGVMATGSRVVRTIAAGQIGNDRPIEITTETWYSQELQTLVMSKTSDPRVGDTVYKLTNIDRSEPALSLFTVPSDYIINKEDKVFGVTGLSTVQVQQ